MQGIYLIFELMYDVFLTYCDMIELILYECIDEYVQRVYETLWLVFIVRDCIGNLCNMYIFIYCYYGWIRQIFKLLGNMASPIFLITNRIFVVGYMNM